LFAHDGNGRDTYDIIQFHPLLPPIHIGPGAYDSVGIREIDTDSTVDDICEFIVEYFHSDVLVHFNLPEHMWNTYVNDRGYSPIAISLLQV
jgi:hypothetical protein